MAPVQNFHKKLRDLCQHFSLQPQLFSHSQKVFFQNSHNQLDWDSFESNQEWNFRDVAMYHANQANPYQNTVCKAIMEPCRFKLV